MKGILSVHVNIHSGVLHIMEQNWSNPHECPRVFAYLQKCQNYTTYTEMSSQNIEIRFMYLNFVRLLVIFPVFIYLFVRISLFYGILSPFLII